jgi:hypothetical protein
VLADARYIIIFAAALGTAFAASEPNRLTDDERREGWQLLFDGRTAAGWIEITGKPFPSNCWTIEDGSLKSIVRTDGAQDIRTTRSYRSFDLQFDWKLLAGGNSGVKYLIQRVDEWNNKAGRQARARGIEYQLADEHHADAREPVRRAGSVYSAIAPDPMIEPQFGSFNHSRIVVSKGRIQHWLNGTKVIDTAIAAPEVQKVLRTNRTKKGEPDLPLIDESPISIQNHSSEAWFRNIKIRVLE